MQVIILFAIDAIGSIPEFFYVFDTHAYPLRYMFMNIGQCALSFIHTI